MDWDGGCHCGAIRLHLSSAQAAERVQYRVCSCSFCTAHAPRWWSDPDGGARLDARPGAARAYRFGTRTADFLFCAECGALVCASCAIDGAEYAVVNLNCIPALAALPLERTARSYEGEDVGARLARRRRSWMPLQHGAPS